MRGGPQGFYWDEFPKLFFSRSFLFAPLVSTPPGRASTANFSISMVGCCLFVAGLVVFVPSFGEGAAWGGGMNVVEGIMVLALMALFAYMRCSRTRAARGRVAHRRGGTTRRTLSGVLFRRTGRTVSGRAFMLRTSEICFGCKASTFISSGAGFMKLSNSGTIIRMTFGMPFDNPGKLKNVAMSNGTSGCGMGASGGNGVRIDVGIVKVKVSTRMGVSVPCKDGGTAMSVLPGFGSDRVALSNRVLPLGGTGIFGKHSLWAAWLGL